MLLYHICCCDCRARRFGSEDESIFFKDYFKTRIWEFIELKSLDVDNVALYVEKKMGDKNYHERCAKFKNEHFELITELSEGNLRMINKLMFESSKENGNDTIKLNILERTNTVTFLKK